MRLLASVKSYKKSQAVTSAIYADTSHCNDKIDCWKGINLLEGLVFCG